MSDINKGFGLLFEMGCGKTLTALAIVLDRITQGMARKKQKE